MASAPRIPRRPTSKGERTGGTILYLDFPEGEDNHLRKFAGIRRYALTRDWEVQTITREELDRDEVKALCAGDGGRAKPIGCIVEALADIRSILPPRLFGDVPVVYLDPSRPLPWRGVAVVSCDNAAVAAAAYGELSAGKPQCSAAVPSSSVFPWNRERISAFSSLCAAFGHPLRVFPARRCEDSQRRIAQIAKWLATLPDRSTVFAANDDAAKDVVAASAIHRHIPKELAILGVDGGRDAGEGGPFHVFGQRPKDSGNIPCASGRKLVESFQQFNQQCVRRIAGSSGARMENTRQNREFINSLDKRLFWDVDIQDVDEERHKRFIIQRVLERGGLGDIRNTVKHYGLPVLTHEAQRIRSLDPVTLSFAVCLCQVPRETFQCCIWNP